MTTTIYDRNDLVMTFANGDTSTDAIVGRMTCGGIDHPVFTAKHIYAPHYTHKVAAKVRDLGLDLFVIVHHPIKDKDVPVVLNREEAAAFRAAAEADRKAFAAHAAGYKLTASERSAALTQDMDRADSDL